MNKQEVIKELNEQKRCWNPEYILEYFEKQNWTAEDLYKACHDFDDVLDTPYENDFTFECSYVEIAECFIDEDKCQEACKKVLSGDEDEENSLESDWNKVKVIKTEIGDESGCWSTLIDTGLGFNVWMDCNLIEQWKEVESDWNQYIFSLDNSDDMMRKTYQENDSNFDICSSVALQAGISAGYVESTDQGYILGPGY